MRWLWLVVPAYPAFGLLHQNRGKTYGYKIMLFLDLFASALIFRDPDVTISAETGLAMRRQDPPLWARLLNGFLDKIREGHCQAAILDDVARARAAIAYLEAPQQGP
jgi:hypothetical protein